jgi:hypothetical protein
MNIAEALAKDPIARAHRGPGNVWFVHIINEESGEERMAVFSDADRACLWIDKLGDAWSDAHMKPLVLDEPDYGNTSGHRQ